MVSLPERYFTYSEWMSAVPKGLRGRTAGRAVRTETVTAAMRPPTRPTNRPPDRLRALLSIRHPPDATAVVVRDQERAVGQPQQRHRAAPAVAAGELPAGDEILARHRAP